MWENLENTYKNYKGSWMVGGDFNDIIGSTEKFGGSNFFGKKLVDWNLIDIGYKGCKYTWSNDRKRRKGLIMKRLDKILGNDE